MSFSEKKIILQVVEKVVFPGCSKAQRGRGFLATTKLFGTCRTAASL
jgi:hypothetical protein